MFRFPFGPRPAPRQMQRRGVPSPQKSVSYGDLLQHASFSPELSFLLSMTLKDGLDKKTTLDMLKNIEPYVAAQDREAIHSIFHTLNMTDNYRRRPPVPPPGRHGAGLSDFSKLSRHQTLLEILQRYASQDTCSMLRGLSQSARTQENFERMSRRIEKLRNMNMSSPENMFEAISMFMPAEEQSKFKNMQNMMRMMGSMKNFKPEDLFKFMGNFK
ncbi:MAG: hypothetical protein M0R40_08655 [Firmicutes bacterium]|nr:hypothetical protein [Bacillota bacterium]